MSVLTSPRIDNIRHALETEPVSTLQFARIVALFEPEISTIEAAFACVFLFEAGFVRDDVDCVFDIGTTKPLTD